MPPAPAGVAAQRGVRKVSKISKSLTNEELCRVLDEIGLHKCVPIVKDEGMDGHELLNHTQKDFTDLLMDNGLKAPKARTMWEKLQSHLKPAEGRRSQHVVRALVVGMDKYGGGLNPLKNSVKDAYAMAAKLESAGVIVTLVTNVTIDELKAETNKYISTLEEGDVGLLFEVVFDDVGFDSLFALGILVVCMLGLNVYLFVILTLHSV